VISERGEIWNPNFSADGRTILYTAVGGGRLVMRTVPAKGGPPSFLLRGAFGMYSPDGRTIAYRRTSYDGGDITAMTSGRIWIADADGDDAHPLGHDFSWMSQIDPEALWPTWSPDGTRIAYQPLYSSPVKIVDVRTGRSRSLGEGTDPSWLDDQTLIVTGYARKR
jgi:Tol biopolymer transport system component